MVQILSEFVFSVSSYANGRRACGKIPCEFTKGNYRFVNKNKRKETKHGTSITIVSRVDQLYLSGSYSELYDCIKNAKSKHRSKCFEVKRNYYLYRVAMLLEDWEKAEKHRNFVVEYGGTLRYREDIIKHEK